MRAETSAVGTLTALAAPSARLSSLWVDQGLADLEVRLARPVVAAAPVPD
jgi:hypothetical protein